MIKCLTTLLKEDLNKMFDTAWLKKFLHNDSIEKVS